jgi:arginase
VAAVGERVPTVGLVSSLRLVADNENVAVTRRRVVLIGVASSAGTHHAGQERAPAALRSRGFPDRLRAEGLTVEDRGEVLREVFVADEMTSTARNLAAVVRVARGLADVVADTIAAGALPLILGGDCTITLGVVAGAQRHDPGTGLLYLDGDADLATPGHDEQRCARRQWHRPPARPGRQ